MNIAEHLELIAEHARSTKNPWLYGCVVCHDTGFETVDTEGRGTVRRCSNGCKPPRPKTFDAPRKRPPDSEVF